MMAAASPFDPNALDTRCRARGDGHVARRNIDRAGDQLAQRGVGLAVRRRGPHPRLDDSAAVGPTLDAFDLVAAAARREANIDDDAVGCRCPWLARHDA